MGRFLKILFVIILLIIIAAIALPFFIDPNDFKPQIQTAIKEKTGRNLSIEGVILNYLFSLGWVCLQGI